MFAQQSLRIGELRKWRTIVRRQTLQHCAQPPMRSEGFLVCIDGQGLLLQWIRDEIRQVQPGLYLGKVYWNKARLIDFALEF